MAPELDFTSKTTINADATGWDPANARAMVSCSALAYSDPALVDRTLKAWHLKLDDFLTAGDTQAFLASSDDLGIVAFRGTQPTDLIDWATDANCVLVQEAPGIMVHRGFQCALDLVWSDVDAFIKTKRRVFVTGHSLGGALACLTAARAARGSATTAKTLSLFTYGQPRVGDATFVDFVNQNLGGRMVRVVNNLDLVPRVPPRNTLGAHYGHCDGVVWIDFDGNLHGNPKYWEALLTLLEVAPQPDELTLGAGGVATPGQLTLAAGGVSTKIRLNGLQGILAKYQPRGRSLASLLDIGEWFLGDEATRLVIRSIGKDALHEPAAMIVDHFMDHYSRLLDGTTGLADS